MLTRIRRRLATCVASAALLLPAAAFTPALAADTGAGAPPPGKDLKVYHIGNSLTRNLPLQRVAKLFESAGGKYDYGTQLGGGMKLYQHLDQRSHGGASGSGTYNVIAPYGEYDNALQNFKFDAVVLQPYQTELDKPETYTDKWPHFVAGDLQAAGAFIEYARGKTKPADGKNRWDLKHPNTKNVATDRFYVYATWPQASAVVEQAEGDKTFANYWARPYTGGVQPGEEFFGKLVTKLNERHPDLPVPVRMIPAGHAMAALDKRIRAGELPGIKAFYDRNQAYFKKARRNQKNKSPFDPEQFDLAAGVLNFYADGVHMNDQPHDGKDSGTIGSYVAALTLYATLTGQSPVGLTAKPYEQFDEKADAELIKAIQQTVWDVVTSNPHTGVKAK